MKGANKQLNEKELLAKETGLFFNNENELDRAIEILAQAGMTFKVDLASTAFVKSEARKINNKLIATLENEGQTPKRALSEADFTTIGLDVLSESSSVDYFLDELKLAVTNEVLFTSIYS